MLELRTKSRDETKIDHGISLDGYISVVEGVSTLPPADFKPEAAVEMTMAMMRIDQVVSARGD